MAGLLGNYDDEPQGLLGGLQRTVMSPAFLAGAGLLTGQGFGGAMQGMRMGAGFEDQRRQDAEKRRQMEQFQGLLGSSTAPADVLALARAQGPEAGMATLGEWIGPAQEARKLDLDYKRAQINKLNREASDAGTTYGKSGSIVQGPNGQFYSVQFGADGSRVILPLEVPGQPPSQPNPAQSQPQPMADGGAGRFAAPGLDAGAPAPMPLTPSRGVSVVGDQMYDAATGNPVRTVGSNIAEGERQKVVGREMGEGQAALPKAQRALQSYEIKSANVNGMIDTALSQTGAWTTGFIGSAAGRIPGTAAHDLSKTLTAIKANLGFETLQDMRDNSPTGGALGQVSNIELELLQSAWGSVEQSQSEEQLRDNLNKIKQIKAQFVEAKRMAYEQDVARFGAQNVPNPTSGQSAPTAAAQPTQPRVRSYNPQTGRLD